MHVDNSLSVHPAWPRVQVPPGRVVPAGFHLLGSKISLEDVGGVGA
ncbi:hypothetical protein EDD25_1026 [Cryobacterium psychrophilum]|nr:hypothetical protein EDD25_1026 [Cryobacterium psychrophilum]